MPRKHISYAVQFADESGEWCSSQTRFASRDEAAEAIQKAKLLETHSVRVVETSDKPNHRMVHGKMISTEALFGGLDDDDFNDQLDATIARKRKAVVSS